MCNMVLTPDCSKRHSRLNTTWVASNWRWTILKAILTCKWLIIQLMHSQYEVYLNSAKEFKRVLMVLHKRVLRVGRWRLFLVRSQRGWHRAMHSDRVAQRVECVNEVTGVTRGQRWNQINTGGLVRHRRTGDEAYTVKCSINLCVFVKKTDIRTREQQVLSWVTGGQRKWSNLLTLKRGLKKMCWNVCACMYVCMCECLRSGHKASTVESVIQPFPLRASLNIWRKDS